MSIFEEDEFEQTTVEETAMEVINFKMSAIAKGYFEDYYAIAFPSQSYYVQSHLPHQNFGAFLRFFIMRKAYETFYQIYGSNSIIVVLGAGYDTAFWRLRDDGIKFKRWIELDKHDVIQFKNEVINKNQIFNPLESFETHEMDFEDDDAAEKLRSIIGIDSKLPVLFIDEFCLMYVLPECVDQILAVAGENDNGCIFSYGMTLTGDKFGSYVLRGLADMGIPLKSASQTESPNKSCEHLKMLGFKTASALNAVEAGKLIVPLTERIRVSNCDYFDDPKQVEFILSHYLFSAGGADSFTLILENNS